MRYLVLFVSVCLCLACKSLHAQGLENDLKGGLYQLTPDWIVVHQLDSGVIYTTKLRQAHSHYDKVTKILFDSIPSGKIEGKDKREKWYGGYLEVVEVGERHNALIFQKDTLYIALNFKRKEIGYDVFITKYTEKDGVDMGCINNDTLDCFSYTFFNIEDIRRLSIMKDFASISKEDFKKIRDLGQARKEMYGEQIERSGGISMYGYIESYEIHVKLLMDSGYNPLIFPEQYSDMLKKYNN